MNLTWSSFQNEIFKTIKNFNGNIVVSALAGSAKTTTLIETVRKIPDTKKILVTAFNKSIQQELSSKIDKDHVEVKTFHSLGLKAITKAFGNVTIDDSKVYKIVRDKLKLKGDLAFNVEKTVSYCKASLNDAPSGISSIIDYRDVDTGELSQSDFTSLVIKTLSLCKNDKKSVNFDDMCWFYFCHDLSMEKFDYVFVDEFQDLNKSQIIMAKKSLAADGRLIVFGDWNQQIYRWRMADNFLIKDLEKEKNTKVLPLPICYRCPQSVIKLTQQVVPDILPYEKSEVGTVNHISFSDLLEKAKSPAVVLSRVNAPLVKTCLQLLKSGKKSNVMGKDIGADLLNIVKKCKKKKISEFTVWLGDWLKKETKRAKNKKTVVELISDKFDCFQYLSDGLTTVEQLKASIGKLFSDEDKESVIMCSTIHKYKGKESENVYILDWTLRFHPKKDEKSPDSEEKNLYYVAITRSKKNLNFVSKTGY